MKHYTDQEIELVLTNLQKVLKELNITKYCNNLYTEYDYDSPIGKNYILLESIIKDTSYKLLDAIKLVINVLFEWDYKIEAKFDITIENAELSIIFHKPVVQYKLDVYTCKKL